MKRFQIFYLLILIVFASCKPQSEIVYFQGALPKLEPDSIYKVRIYPGDLLSITVFTINTEAFPYLAPEKQIGSDTRSAYEKSFMVNEVGELKLPLIGNVTLKGLTIHEATVLLEKKFHDYIDDPIVSIKKLNFKVTVLGEVNKPGTYNIMNEKATLPEVLGMAGDLSQFADREIIRLIRDENNIRTDYMINLTDANSLSAVTYYMHPDDIIYVQPLPRRAFQNTIPNILVFTSMITTTIVVLTFILHE